MSYRRRAVGAGVGYALAGPAGAVAGWALSGDGGPGYDMSGIPFGVHVEAEHDDDAVGRRWTLRFLSEVPAEAHVALRVMNDAGEYLPGNAPFAGADGVFVASTMLRDGQSTLYVPFGAVVYTSPKYLSLEVSVWVAGPDGGGAPTGKAVLDADLPKAPRWHVADYLQPLVSLCMGLLRGADQDALEATLARLAEALGFDAAALPAGTMAAMLDHARSPQPLKEALAQARFRFPATTPEALLELVRGVTRDEDAEEEEPTPSQRALLDELAKLS